jgi:hypothetical protein
MKLATTILVVLFSLGVLLAQDIPMEGLVGYWKLDEGTGGIAGDSSGYGAHGEIWGATDWVEGYMGTGLEFDGIDGYVDMGIGDGQFDLDYGLTLSVWVNQWTLGNGEDDPWLGKGDNAYAIKHQRGNFYEFFVFDGGWHSCEVPLDSSHLYTWHHFAGTYDGYEAKMYVDGVPADTLLLESVISYSEHPVSLAWNSQATDRFTNCQIDEAMIYNIPLTDEQILQLYNVKSAVMQERNIANQFRLQQNYPNPFNPVTNISYTIPATLPVTLDVYNTLGELVATVVNETQTIGTHTATFDGADLPSGIYFYKLQAGDILHEMKKMMLVK